jgi:hypothetical protein
MAARKDWRFVGAESGWFESERARVVDWIGFTRGQLCKEARKSTLEGWHQKKPTRSSQSGQP